MFRKFTPTQVLLIFFVVVIAAGAILLSLPVSHKNVQNCSILNDIFMASSAICVTGLAVVDIGTTYTLFGKTVILLLMQIGGLGYMTLSTMIAFIIGKITLRERMMVKEILDISSFEGLKLLLRQVLIITLAFEGAGALMLTFSFLREYGFWKALYYGIFHSVSAFNNCGYALMPDNLESYHGNFIVLPVIMLLIVFGGIGYLVIRDLWYTRSFRQSSTNTKVTVATTAVLLLGGFLFIFLAEYGNPLTMGNMPLGEKILSSMFHSVVPRTAGFNTLSMQGLHSVTLVFTLFLMFVGASPGSTGGGIKTTTFAVLLAAVWSSIRGKRDANLFNRKMPDEIIHKTVSVSTLSLLLVFCATLLLLITEDFNFMQVIFEVTSAFGTVGLSTGITPKLTSAGKILIVIVMFIGRLGPLTIGMATFRKKEELPYQYPADKILIG